MHGVELVVYNFHVSVWCGPVVVELSFFFQVVDMFVAICVSGKQLHNFCFKAVDIIVQVWLGAGNVLEVSVQQE